MEGIVFICGRGIYFIIVLLIFLEDTESHRTKTKKKNMQIFEITANRILSYFIGPLITIIGFVGISFYATHDFSSLSDSFLGILFSILFLFQILPIVILLINHYYYFKGTTFEYDFVQEEFSFSKNNDFFKFKKSEITNLVQYDAGGYRIPWSGIYLWEITIKEETIKLTSIIISEKDIDKIFGKNQIERTFRFFVLV